MADKRLKKLIKSSKNSNRNSNTDGKEQDGLVPDDIMYANENPEGAEVLPFVADKTKHLCC